MDTTHSVPKTGAGEPFDAIVIGSGPGGAAVARELTARGWKVLILEMGGNAPVTGAMVQSIRELWLPGRGLLMTSGFLGILRGVTVGGSSVYAWATALDPAYEAFDRHGIDLRAEVAQVKRDVAVTTVPIDLIGPTARRIMESAVALSIDWAPLPKFLDPSLLGGAPMGTYGAPSYAAKWTARRLVDEAVRDGATLLTRARARRVLVKDGVAVGVEYHHRGHLHSATASTVVVAAGGIGSPGVLRRSGVVEAGYTLFCDPLVAITGELPGPGRGPELPMMGGAVFEDEGFLLTDMSVPGWLSAIAHAEVGRLDRIPRFRRSAMIMIKIRDDVEGHIGPRGMVHKRLTDRDRLKLDRGVARARRILWAAGARRLVRSMPFASHPGGTVPIGRLVDSDLQTSVPGLYVCDASVISDPWGRPPMLTLLALGRRLARHLAPEQPRLVEQMGRDPSEGRGRGAEPAARSATAVRSKAPDVEARR